jgi:hypothetical protein
MAIFTIMSIWREIYIQKRRSFCGYGKHFINKHDVLDFGLTRGPGITWGELNYSNTAGLVFTHVRDASPIGLLKTLATHEDVIFVNRRHNYDIVYPEGCNSSTYLLDSTQECRQKRPQFQCNVVYLQLSKI